MPVYKDVYTRYYTQQQQGGALPVFRGGRHDQDGAGLGSILSGIFRHIAPIARRVLPIAARGLTTFAKNTLSAHQRGVPLGEAARAAIGPAIGAAARTALGIPQAGGRRRPTPRKRASASMLGCGVDHPPPPPKRRKRAAPKRRQTGSGRSTAAKRRRRQAGAGKRRTPAKRKLQSGGRKRVYKKRGGGAKRKSVRISKSTSGLHF